MSYDVYLNDAEGNIIKLKYKHCEGGTYQLGGSDDAHLNITGNYGGLYCEYFHPEGLSFIHGKKASETNLLMFEAVSKLGCEKLTEDYYVYDADITLFKLGLKKLLSQQQIEYIGRLWPISVLIEPLFYTNSVSDYYDQTQVKV